ncbi:ATP-dependent RNA helicase RhlB [Amphritea balenae]|uniref:ATP-dependent RNA helicase RhlB n=1 Tax=Amphritea balenae TaxID=452629 RepID=A0A3P1SM44_9GAMM|nr:ATP-dependent RNA helicase RhlB [Amphritea balenae]GGK82912.1 ATP-dependent RNA helicase RhlB [Amphritea balenae]
MLKKLFNRSAGNESANTNQTTVPAQDAKPANDNATKRSSNSNASGSTGRDKKAAKPKAKSPANKTVKAEAKKQVKPWSLADFPVVPEEGKKRFHDFKLPDVVMHAIADLNFRYCSDIQAATLSLSLEGKDMIGKAQTGTGKTAAFLISIITDLVDYPLEYKPARGVPRALIIAPTRELALQIASDAEETGKYCDLSVVALVGGMDYEKQRRQLAARPVDILVATPGRLIDFVRSKDVDLGDVEVLVLDEADRMLSMGFIPDVRTIIRHTPRKGDRQTLLYSATFTDDIMSLAQQWTVDAEVVEIAPEQKSTDSVEQLVYLVSRQDKYRLLRNFMQINQLERVIVFGNRRDETRRLAERLQKDGLAAALMSGEITQQKRLKTLEDFRSGKINILVATDVAGRGIHVEGVSHVINYALPEDADDYVHRIGRTGRAGSTGTSISFATEDDAFLLPEIEEVAGVKMECVYPDPNLLEPV